MIKCPEKYSAKIANMSSKGTIKISNLKIPLRKEFVESRAKGKGIYFCLLFAYSNFIFSSNCILLYLFSL